jgi:hypothetical protein
MYYKLVPLYLLGVAAAVMGCTSFDISIPPQFSNNVVCYAESNEQEVYDEEIPPKGKYRFGSLLQRKLEENTDDDAFFYVMLQPNRLSEVYPNEMRAFTFEGKSQEEWQKEVVVYFQGYDQYEHAHMEANTKFTIEDKLRWRQEWIASHGPDPQFQIERALLERNRMLAKLESERLQKAGISVILQEYKHMVWMYAYLSREQLQHFPVGDNSYHLLLASKPES